MSSDEERQLMKFLGISEAELEADRKRLKNKQEPEKTDRVPVMDPSTPYKEMQDEEEKRLDSIKESWPFSSLRGLLDKGRELTQRGRELDPAKGNPQMQAAKQFGMDLAQNMGTGSIGKAGKSTAQLLEEAAKAPEKAFGKVVVAPSRQEILQQKQVQNMADTGKMIKTFEEALESDDSMQKLKELLEKKK